MPEAAAKPGRDCPRCPRLAEFRHAWRAKEPTWFNAPEQLSDAQFQQPNGDAGAGANFGRISATSPPRLIQLAVKLLW